jgi:hypothetical protein
MVWRLADHRAVVSVVDPLTLEHHHKATKLVTMTRF